MLPDQGTCFDATTLVTEMNKAFLILLFSVSTRIVTIVAICLLICCHEPHNFLSTFFFSFFF